jgi:long-chain fatty acid transport protein
MSIMMTLGLYAQTGHILQAVGAVNTSMGGAATGQALDITGALHWNPAGLAVFDSSALSINAGLFFSSPKLSSTVPTPEGPFSGVTEDDRGLSVMPAVAFVSAKADSKHRFGVSAFGISGFGVTFPENAMNPINAPQSQGGFGLIQSDYQVLQVGLAYAYKISNTFSVGIQPTFNYSALELAPNPLSSPSSTLGYPVSNQATALGVGAQIGLFYKSETGLSLGLSYKTPQKFSEFDFENTYLDGSAAPNVNFQMDYPAIYSAGLGYSADMFDLAIDYRYVDYANTEGFEQSGWTPTASVAGFGWESISIVSAGLQLKLVDKLPVRIGYTYSTNPITEELAFFSVPATAIIKNAYQLGLGYTVNSHLTINATFHHGTSSGETTGQLLSPLLITPTDPLGVVPTSEVSYEMTTDLLILGVDYSF